MFAEQFFHVDISHCCCVCMYICILNTRVHMSQCAFKRDKFRRSQLEVFSAAVLDVVFSFLCCRAVVFCMNVNDRNHHCLIDFKIWD